MVSELILSIVLCIISCTILAFVIALSRKYPIIIDNYHKGYVFARLEFDNNGKKVVYRGWTRKSYLQKILDDPFSITTKAITVNLGSEVKVFKASTLVSVAMLDLNVINIFLAPSVEL